jgi:exonuclease SbcC
MRLIRLKIRNIASLKGEHDIDFLEIQRGSPLFAITGETGAGKSSILNSIGLALYGEIYKKNINQIDVVTLGEKEGSIELIFQVKGKYYLADWRARVLKQNGEPYSTPQSPVRNLYKIEGPEFSFPKLITNESTTELLNLDFEQFCRCIILNQGEFAKFLNSSFKDRRDILEKLYPGEVLDNISRELEAEKKVLEKEKHELDIQLGTLRGDNVSGELLLQQKIKLEGELKNLEAVFKNLETLEYHFISLQTYHDKFAQNERSKDNIKSTMAVETTKFNHILKNGELILERYQSAIKKQETELPLLQTYLKKEETLKLLKEGWLNLQKKNLELTSGISVLEQKLKAKTSELESLNSKLSDAQSSLSHSVAELKSSRSYFEPLFELFSEKELLQEERKGKSLRLSELEVLGKEQKAQVEDLEARLKLIPENIKDLEKENEVKKSVLSQEIDKKQRAEIKSQEIQKQIEAANVDIKNFEIRLTNLSSEIKQLTEDLFPLEATLKLQEVLSASQICLTHAEKAKAEECPVCEQKVAPNVWGPLKTKLAQTDLSSIRHKHEETSKRLAKAQHEQELVMQKLRAEKDNLNIKLSEDKTLEAAKSIILPTMKQIDEVLSALNKQVWDFDQISKDLSSRKFDLQKTREHYAKLKAEITQVEKSFSEKTQKLDEVASSLKAILPIINRDTIRDFKIEVRNFTISLDIEISLEKIRQEERYLQEQKTKALTDSKTHATLEKEELQKIDLLKSELDATLKGELASGLISKINELVKKTTEEWNRQIEDQKKQELILKDSQGRLYQLDELTKDFDLHFTKELHTVKDVARNSTHPELIKLKDLQFDFASPRELLIPLKDLILSEKEASKLLSNKCREGFASVATRLSDWEKLQDKIQLMELKAKDINSALARKMRLFEVLGKDELRTFVLSLVEENLIQQTNDELQKLCQGRYEIVHQTKSLKMTPEFFILDKFREGGRRKVSTLSGGETFMVSLAMALGLAEMTRGQAEIDSLFIDEGFGTLDQDSLEDVLDMLQQIQTRGLMVGIISHIKTLTNALPVNLVLTKRQDGTSSSSLQFN